MLKLFANTEAVEPAEITKGLKAITDVAASKMLRGAARGNYVFSDSGEDGSLPEMAEDFEPLKQTIKSLFQSDSVPSFVNPDDLSTFWSSKEHFDAFWKLMRNERVFDFSWGRPGMSDRVTMRTIPLDFVPSTEDDGSLRWVGGTTLVEDQGTSGTSFRRAKCEPGREWRKNAIANLYHVDVQFRGSTVLDVYRHGIIGYKAGDIPQLTTQTTLLLRHAIARQARRQYPTKHATRVLSINTLHQPAAVTVPEAQMALRQSQCFAAAAQVLAAKGQQVEIAEFSLPLNTDIGSLDDAGAALNFAFFVKAFSWLASDLLHLAGQLLLSASDFTEAFGPDAATNKAAHESIIKAMSADGVGSAFREALGTNMAVLAVRAGTGCHVCEETICEMSASKCPECYLAEYLAAFDRQKEHPQKGWSVFFEQACILVANTVGKSLGHHPHAKRRPCMCVAAVMEGFAEALLFSIPEPVKKVMADLGVQQRLETAILGLGSLAILNEAEMDSSGTVGKRANASEKYSKRFTRVSSAQALSILAQCIQGAVFINCKSGLDRTGLMVGTMLGITSLWHLFAEQRISVAHVACNYNYLRSREGRDDKGIFLQPSRKAIVTKATKSYSTMSSAGNLATAFLSLSRKGHVMMREGIDSITSIRSKKKEAVDLEPITHEDMLAVLSAPSEASEASESGFYSGVFLTTAPLVLLWDLQGQDEALYELYPLFCVLRNFVLCYLAEASNSIAFASCGVRGLKYEQHPLAAQMIPAAVMLPSGQREPLSRLMVSGMKQLTGFKLTAMSLCDFGSELLIDTSKYRKS